MNPSSLGGALPTLAVVLVTGCGAWSGDGPGCRPLSEPVALPDTISESSGVAASRQHAGVYWTLNDGRYGDLYAVDAEGTLLGIVPVDVPARDWEDLALAPCSGDSSEGDCLWIADTGDNYAERSGAVIYRLPEPDPDGEAGPVESFPVRYPDGARDVEAMFVMPDGRLFLISKGSTSRPAMYRYPLPLRPDVAVDLELVHYLDDGQRSLPRQITGAAASADGSLVVVRTYETLTFMGFGDDGLRSLEDGTVNLRTVREAQGEAVAFGPDGDVVLSSEAGPLGQRGSMVILRCDLPSPTDLVPDEPEQAGS